jgi:hypothetical protein
LGESGIIGVGRLFFDRQSAPVQGLGVGMPALNGIKRSQIIQRFCSKGVITAEWPLDHCQRLLR